MGEDERARVIGKSKRAGVRAIAREILHIDNFRNNNNEDEIDNNKRTRKRLKIEQNSFFATRFDPRQADPRQDDARQDDAQPKSRHWKLQHDAKKVAGLKHLQAATYLKLLLMRRMQINRQLLR